MMKLLVVWDAHSWTFRVLLLWGVTKRKTDRQYTNNLFSKENCLRKFKMFTTKFTQKHWVPTWSVGLHFRRVGWWRHKVKILSLVGMAINTVALRCWTYSNEFSVKGSFLFQQRNSFHKTVQSWPKNWKSCSVWATDQVGGTAHGWPIVFGLLKIREWWLSVLRTTRFKESCLQM